MTGRAGHIAAAALAPVMLAAAPVKAADPLDLSAPVELSCATNAVQLDVNPFKASEGSFAVTLTADDPAKPDGDGRWKVTVVPPGHDRSFAAVTLAGCGAGCPFTRGENGGLQLWSPKPMGLTDLDDATALVLVAIDMTSLELKASTFKKSGLAALERGTCKTVAAAAGTHNPAGSAADTETPAAPPAQPSELGKEPEKP